MQSQSDNLSVIIDMDKVVFKTNQFIDDVAKIIDQHFNISQELFTSQIPNFYKAGEGNLRLYDFFEHINELNLNPDLVESTIINSFKGKDYSYPDVSNFLDFLNTKTDDITLLTYGDTRFQQLKYTCAPTLHHLYYVDTLLPKTKYISDYHKTGQGIIIDDKIIHNLPVNFKQIWLTRPDAYPNGEGLKSLNQIISQWNQLS